MLMFVLSDESGIDHRQFRNHGKYMLERATRLLYRSKYDYNLGIASLEKKAALRKRRKKHEKVMNTFRNLDLKPQENCRFEDLGNNRKIILIICLVELKCDINLTEQATERNHHIRCWRNSVKLTKAFTRQTSLQAPFQKSVIKLHVI
jgi:hypothetical protein